MLETPRLLLRPWREADREPFRRMNADPRVMQFFAAELRATGEFTGLVGLARVPFEAHFTPCVEIGWRITPERWNRGLATEGAHECLRYAFHDLALAEVVAFTEPANLPSHRVMEKLGMTHRPTDDFEHPRLPEGHPLRRHVLYRATLLQSQL
ncbi:MAG: GNAT family N-acetyltransferase [Candidatus Solibacter sp.]|nr:GNAT family N-acetyltransferase [Candidatus Solibacter sp.]